MVNVTVEMLMKSGAHFGHLTRKWNPKMKDYVCMTQNGIHIIDLNKTLACLDEATRFIREVVRKGGDVLFVGTKKQAKEIVQREADRCGMFYVVERWLGGTLTNFSTIKRSIRHLQKLEKDKSIGYGENLTKKEKLALERERIKLADLHRGIKDMRKLPDVLVVVDTTYDNIAVQEARRLDIPIIAILDTNADPTIVDYPIPANDDSIQTINLIITELADAVIEAKNSRLVEVPPPVEEAES
ncbi:MAG: 30S ribosomal protein S2 [Candidatus Marinimicrobia bacterium]|jgi:small subunit ribosomal protein S2|nr:30S ribosomal protein S2 [Candidatus Neomarinimicrobiota bacterium]OQC47819.1 MAG: 30S ribosomal protein S2 [Candidatus Marinimicrobia bacterium ADurb.Bin030]MBP9005953.1 30S ribosomal protein S2 [Candidatus Neomarinimicrobiota bacterium]HNZ37039.1 30S ribosomal protein S2 [Candidatus Neomarinimicrobiota bacterium]HOD37881.1 30S ribosomal protein S2 [Candidatus Neomarinimicrobiota bacterium]